MTKAANERNRAQALEPSIDARVYEEEIDRAAERIGSTHDQVARWLVGFSQKNLDNLSVGKWIDVRYEPVRAQNVNVVFGMAEHSRDVFESNVITVLSNPDNS